MSAYYCVNFQQANNEDLHQAFRLTAAGETPLDLTGASLRMAVAALDGTPILQANTSNGAIAVTDAAAGEFEIDIPAASLSALIAGVYSHDLILVQASRTRRIWQGTVTLIQGIAQ